MSKAFKHQLLKDMVRIRRIEERIADEYVNQEMRCPIHLCVGQEAIPVGISHALDREDYMMSNHRSHGHYLAKGGDLNGMIAELYGKATGCTGGKGGSMHLIDDSCGFLGAAPIVAGTLPIATGVALASQMKRDGRVTVSCFGDAVIEEGVFHESVNFAVLKKLPIIYICENNLYSVNSPLSVRQPPGRTISDVAEGHGLTTFRGDGNDVEVVFGLAQKAVRHARQGRGPVFLELLTYRWLEHCGPNLDHGMGYRTESEFLEWKKRCPIRVYQAKLMKNEILCESDMEDMMKEVSSEIDGAFLLAKKAPFPKESTFNEHVYAS